MQPFLKWPGGKRWLVSRYKNIFPKEYNTYYEPFLGGGSAFFYLEPKLATIADINVDLINTYRVMAKKTMQLREMLEIHQERHCDNYYYNMRNEAPTDIVARAARFIYLNRTCFNGMYRVNSNGKFNVPKGTRDYFLEDIDLFEDYSRLLQNIKIRAQDFVVTLRTAAEGDLIFADPPYAIASQQDTFIKYNGRLFSWKDQIRLLNALVRARDRGAIIISTNALYPQLKKLYEEQGFITHTLERFSSISGISEGRGKREEMLITSYPIKIE